eukprot:SAG31_NODE_5443_length_2535_cov_2.629310_2_plen_410_part_01
MKMLLRIRNKALYQVLEGFKLRVTQSREQRLKLDLAKQFVRRMLFALQYKCLDAWHKNLEAARRRRLAMQMAMRLQNIELYKCFMKMNDWVIEAQKKREKMARAKQLVAKFLRALEHKCLRQWLHFHDMVARKQMALQMVLRLQSQALFKAFSGFVANVDYVRAKRDREAIARNMVRRMANVAVSKCWSKWLDFHDQIARTAMAMQMLKRLQNQLAYIAWSQWLANVDRARRKRNAAAFLKRAQNQAACKCLLNWHTYTVQTRVLANQEQSALKMLKRIMNQQLHTAFSQWHFYAADTVSKRQLAQKMVRRLQNKHLYTAYNHWYTWTVDVREKREGVRAMLLKLMNRTLHEAFARWQFWAEDVAWKRESAQQMVKRLMNGKLYQAYSQWQFWASDTREKRELALGMVKK